MDTVLTFKDNREFLSSRFDSGYHEAPVESRQSANRSVDAVIGEAKA